MNEQNVTQTTPAATQASVTPAASAPAPVTQAPSAMDNLKAAAEKSKVTAAQTQSPTAVDQTKPAVDNPYKPNFKYKVNKEEKEIPEAFRSIVKDAETEKQVRELFEKSHGLDLTKPKVEQLKTENQELLTWKTNMNKSLTALSKFVQKEDLGGFFQATDIPFEMVARYVHQELLKREMPEAERNRIQSYEMDRRRLLALEQENEDLKTNYSTTSQQAREMEFNQAMSRPEVQAIASKYDSFTGKQNGFAVAVANKGALAYQMSGGKFVMPVEQAISETMAEWGFLMNQQAPVAAAPQTQTQAAPKPVLPNVGSQGSSPIKQGVKSVADLRKIAAAMTGS